MIGPWAGSAEPHGGVAARNNVLLNTKRGNVKAVDHVLRGHDQFKVTANGHMQFIDLTLPFHMLQLPHPLRCDHVDFGGILRRSAHIEENQRPPNKHHYEEAERNDRPANFQDERTMDGSSFTSMAAPILHRKKRDHGKNEQRGRTAHHYEKNVEQIYGQSVGGRAGRPKWKVIEHIDETC